MRRRAVAALLALACTTAAASGDPCTAARSLVAELASRGLFQGAFVIDFGGEATCEGAHGHADVEHGVSFTTRTASDGGSIAKTMTAAAILRLAAQGRVDLEAPVRKYIPGYPHAATRVHHLIEHSAGLPGYDWFDARLGLGTLRTSAMQLEMISTAGLEPRFPPGTAFAYDNAAYDAAALVVQAASGASYGKYLEREFFEPFGMRDAFVRPASLADFPGPRTRGYRRGKAGLEPFDALEGEAFHGGGNVYASAADLQRWAAAFARNDPIVAPARRAAQARARLASGRATGLSLSSWYSDAAGARHYYTGHHQGFYVLAYWDARTPRSFAFVVNQLLPSWLEAQLARALVGIVEGEPAALPEAPETSAAPSQASRWRLDGLGEIDVAPGSGRRLLVTPPSGVEYEAFPAGDRTWYAPGLDARLHWDKSGRLIWNTVFVQARGERRDSTGP
jgi:CubicO group peptidase (beta-lactamase class C family)